MLGLGEVIRRPSPPRTTTSIAEATVTIWLSDPSTGIESKIGFLS